MSIVRRLRIEDLLAFGFTLVMLLVAGFGAVIRSFRFEDQEYWEMSFIIAPLSLLIFLASLQYAIRGSNARVGVALTDIAVAVRDWSPFLVFMLAYEAFRLRIWLVVLPQDKDAMLMNIDRLLFGETPAVILQQFSTPLLTNLLSLAYFSHLVLPPILAFTFYRRDKLIFRQFLLAVLTAGVLGFVGYLSVPAVGPGIAFESEFHNDLRGEVATTLLSMVDTARAPRDVFPSLHVAIAAIVLWFGRKLGKMWFVVLTPIVLGNWFATLYLRYHYMIDVLAGWAVAVAAVALASVLLRLEAKWCVS